MSDADAMRMRSRFAGRLFKRGAAGEAGEDGGRYRQSRYLLDHFFLLLLLSFVPGEDRSVFALVKCSVGVEMPRRLAAAVRLRGEREPELVLSAHDDVPVA